MSNSILVIGESLVDIVHRRDGSIEEYVGGSPANLAVALTRLGARVELTTAVGPDSHGAMILDHLASAGVTLAAEPCVLDRTATALAALDDEGVATYTFNLSGDLPETAVSESRLHVHTGSIGAVLPPGSGRVVEALAAHRGRATLSYDINARPAITGAGADLVASVEQVAAMCDLVKASDEDLEIVYPGLSVDAAARHLLGLGPSAVVVTRSEHGATCFTQSMTASIRGGTVDVVDTIAAGDTFCAALLDGLLRAGVLGRVGASSLGDLSAEVWRAILDRAAAAAEINVGRAGAAPPTIDELTAFLSAGRAYGRP